MPKMRAAQVTRPGGPFEFVEREIPQPAAGHIRIKVQACGVCHSDSLVKEGHWPGLQYPRVPGHEVVGVVDAVGADVLQWKTGPARCRDEAHCLSKSIKPFAASTEARRTRTASPTSIPLAPRT